MVPRLSSLAIALLSAVVVLRLHLYGGSMAKKKQIDIQNKHVRGIMQTLSDIDVLTPVAFDTLYKYIKELESVSGKDTLRNGQ